MHVDNRTTRPDYLSPQDGIDAAIAAGIYRFK